MLSDQLDAVKIAAERATINAEQAKVDIKMATETAGIGLEAIKKSYIVENNENSPRNF